MQAVVRTDAPRDSKQLKRGAPDMTEDILQRLREVYDGSVDTRDRRSTPAWEDERRNAFVEMLHETGARSLLEVGAATGTDAVFFQSEGFDVVCVDLSPAMVRRCREKGLNAHLGDVSDLQFPQNSFDAVYAKNCLIHVPKAGFHETLVGIDRLLRPGRMFYLAQYGGFDFEGIFDGDPSDPKRFFSFYTDERLREVVSTVFHVHSFGVLPHGWAGLHYQSLVVENLCANENRSTEGR